MPVRKLLLSVGAMKAGTTFLFDVFRKHPEIYFTPEKELHFFADIDGLSYELQAPLVPSVDRSTANGTKLAPHTILTPEFRHHRVSMVMHRRFAQLRDLDELREIVRWHADRYLVSPVDEASFDRVFEHAGELYAADFHTCTKLRLPLSREEAKTELHSVTQLKDTHP